MPRPDPRYAPPRAALCPPRRRPGRRLSLGGGFLAALAIALPAPSAAFHEKGVGSCAGCHTMHDSQDGGPLADPFVGEPLLRAGSATDLCLTCHAASNGAVLGGDPVHPPPELGGGIAAHLAEDVLHDGDSVVPYADPIGGFHAGHSIVAPAWGLDPDPDYLAAPGGTYPSSGLGCTSCHDPHGNASFRMLHGVGPVGSEGYAFAYPAPLADGLDLVTQVESPTSHTAYQAGWSAWCANCHGFYHESSPGFQHPVDRSIANERDTYNRYAGPSAPYGGDIGTAYLPETPIEDPMTTTSDTFGARGASRISCMTCHRAHATSAPAALRWDPNVLRISGDGMPSGSYAIPDPYADPEQRSLCVKCHYGQAVGHGMDQPCLECHREPDPVAQMGLSGGFRSLSGGGFGR